MAKLLFIFSKLKKSLHTYLNTFLNNNSPYNMLLFTDTLFQNDISKGLFILIPKRCAKKHRKPPSLTGNYIRTLQQNKNNVDSLINLKGNENKE